MTEKRPDSWGPIPAVLFCLMIAAWILAFVLLPFELRCTRTAEEMDTDSMFNSEGCFVRHDGEWVRPDEVKGSLERHGS